MLDLFLKLSTVQRSSDQSGDGKTRSLRIAPDIEMTFLPVPAGKFLMGSERSQDEHALDNETPQHRIYLPSYHIGRYPVTVVQFAAFVSETGYQTTAEQLGSGHIWTGSRWKAVPDIDWRHPRGPQSDVQSKQDHPVTLVSWHDAAHFCAWLNSLGGQGSNQHSGESVLRLPTEAEWEKAARGADGRPLPWGNATPNRDCCNFNLNLQDTSPVGHYSMKGRHDSPYGCADMAGNVWEWTHTLVRSYPYQPDDGREDPHSRAPRVWRGGSWKSIGKCLRCAHRRADRPTVRSVNVGFRVVFAMDKWLAPDRSAPSAVMTS